MGEQTYDCRGKKEIRGPEDLRAALAGAGIPHYVYVLCLPPHRDRMTPYYVGKGQAERVLAHEEEARDPETTGTKAEVIRSIWRTGEQVVRFIDSFHATDPWNREEELINAFGLMRDGTGILANHDRYAESRIIDGVELRKWAGTGNKLPRNFIRRHMRLMVGPRAAPKHSVYGKICRVLETSPGITGERLVELILSIDFSGNPSPYTQLGRAGLPWLAKYIDGGFYKKNQYIQEYRIPTAD